MKKAYPTYIDSSVLNHEKITVSAGVKGCQLLVNAKELTDYLKATIDIITTE